MLPSLRLIAATFLCSFVIVFVGFRLAATSRLANEAGYAANPLPLQLTGADAAADMRRIDRSAPVMFDLRFAMGATAPPSVPSGLTMHAIDRARRESGIEMSEPVTPPPAAQPAIEPNVEAKVETRIETKPEPVEPNNEPKAEPKIEIAALPEPAAAAADAPPPPPGPPTAVAAIETTSDVENVGTTGSVDTKPVPVKAAAKKPAAAKHAAVTPAAQKPAAAKQAAAKPKKKVVRRRAPAPQAATDPVSQLFTPFPATSQ